jgi:hypothetical protein
MRWGFAFVTQKYFMGSQALESLKIYAKTSMRENPEPDTAVVLLQTWREKVFQTIAAIF